MLRSYGYSTLGIIFVLFKDASSTWTSQPNGNVIYQAVVLKMLLWINIRSIPHVASLETLLSNGKRGPFSPPRGGGKAAGA
jgi:hypothetical protein